MEKYQLIFCGERCGPFAKLTIEEHLKLLKLSNAANEKLAGGAKVVLKSGLDESTMQEQKAAFAKRGLITKQQLTLNPEAFHTGLTPLSNHDNTRSLPVIVLQKENAPAKLISLPSETMLDTGERGKPILVKYLSHQIGFMVLMTLAAAISLLLLMPVMVLAQSIIGYDAIASVCGVLFLIASLLVLPRLFQPLQATAISMSDSEIQLFDQVSLIIGNKKLDWYSAEHHGSFEISSASASAYSNRPLYSWNAHNRIEDTGGAAIDEINSAITQGTIFEILGSIWKQLEDIIQRRSPAEKTHNIDWKCEPASAVFDTRNEVVALIYRHQHAAYKIVRAENFDDLVLHAFCLSVHKGGLG